MSSSSSSPAPAGELVFDCPGGCELRHALSLGFLVLDATEAARGTEAGVPVVLCGPCVADLLDGLAARPELELERR